MIATRHAPETCARYYAEAIEGFYVDARTPCLPALLDAIATTPPRPNKVEWSRPVPGHRPKFAFKNTRARQLLLDVSATIRTEVKTGIERTARALTLAFLERPPDGFRIEPAYLSNEGGAWHYRYARRFTLRSSWAVRPTHSSPTMRWSPRPGICCSGLTIQATELIEAEATGPIR